MHSVTMSRNQVIKSYGVYVWYQREPVSLSPGKYNFPITDYAPFWKEIWDEMVKHSILSEVAVKVLTPPYNSRSCFFVHKLESC